MKSPTARLWLCTAFALLLPITAQAHTALQESTPANGAVVTVAPAYIDLVFNGPVKLIKLDLMGVGHEMPTNFEAKAEAMASFRVETPGMHPGQFTVNWAVIGADGHTVTDTYSFGVDPNAAESPAAEHGHGGDSDAGHSHGGDAHSH